MTTIKYHARNATARMSTSALTINTTNTLATAASASTLFTAVLKDVTIVPPEGAVELVNLLGETSGFQNALFEEKAYAAASISGTMLMSEAEYLELMMAGTGTQIATNTYTRYQYGDSSTGKTRSKIGAIFVGLSNGTNAMNVLLNNVLVTKLGDVKPTGTDGHWERSFEAMCLPKDYYEEFLN